MVPSIILTIWNSTWTLWLPHHPLVPRRRLTRRSLLRSPHTPLQCLTPDSHTIIWIHACYCQAFAPCFQLRLPSSTSKFANNRLVPDRSLLLTRLWFMLHLLLIDLLLVHRCPFSHPCAPMSPQLHLKPSTHTLAIRITLAACLGQS
jgi:hypothetical protein